MAAQSLSPHNLCSGIDFVYLELSLEVNSKFILLCDSTFKPNFDEVTVLSLTLNFKINSLQIFLLASPPSKVVTVVFRLHLYYLIGPIEALLIPVTKSRKVVEFIS